jgi:hypothetical protein
MGILNSPVEVVCPSCGYRNQWYAMYCRRCQLVFPAIEYGRKLATALEVIAAFNYREVDSTMHGQPTAEARIAMEALDE